MLGARAVRAVIMHKYILCKRVKNWTSSVNLFKWYFSSFEFFLFVASYQHKKSPKFRKLFKIMYSMSLYYNRWVLEPLWRLIMQKD
jgi:hypothetical protein